MTAIVIALFTKFVGINHVISPVAAYFMSSRDRQGGAQTTAPPRRFT